MNHVPDHVNVYFVFIRSAAREREHATKQGQGGDVIYDVTGYSTEFGATAYGLPVQDLVL